MWGEIKYLYTSKYIFFDVKYIGFDVKHKVLVVFQKADLVGVAVSVIADCAHGKKRIT